MIRIQIGGAARTIRNLRVMTERLTDFQSFFKRNRRALLRDLFRRRFATEGVFGGGRRWAELTPRYAATKYRAVGSKPILERTGSLRGSLTASSHPLQIEKIGRKEYVFGTSHRAAAFIQRGTMFMPPREIFPEGQHLDFELAVRELIRAYIFKGK